MGWGDIAQGAAMGGSTGAMFGGVGAPIGIGVGALLGMLQGNAKDKKNAAVNEARAVEMANSPFTGRPITEAVNEPNDFAKTAGAIAGAAGSYQSNQKALADDAFKKEQLKLMQQNSLMSSSPVNWRSELMNEYLQRNDSNRMMG
jgi:hypothetical protein